MTKNDLIKLADKKRQMKAGSDPEDPVFETVNDTRTVAAEIARLRASGMLSAAAALESSTVEGPDNGLRVQVDPTNVQLNERGRPLAFDKSAAVAAPAPATLAEAVE